MDDKTKRATFINLLLLALADGKIAPKEASYLKKFKEAANISEMEAAEWAREAQFDRKFQAIDDSEAAKSAVLILARMVRVDNAFDAAEQEAFINMGKALGFSPDDLGPALREVWATDPDTLLAGLKTNDRVSNEPIYIIDDDSIDREAFKKAAQQASLQFTTLNALSRMSPSPRIVFFHASDDRADSQARLRELRTQFPESYIAFVARRDQAPQIGLLLEAGANRCFVAPLYPNEIDRAMETMISS